MPTQVRCYCRGNPACELCHGEKFYSYQPSAQGWVPFKCPTCSGTGTLHKDGNEMACFTCKRDGWVDPANPPFAPGWRGALRVGLKVFFGGC